MLLAISSPYSRRGELFKAYDQYWGENNAPVLVWKAASWEMNPSVDRAFIDREFSRDAERAKAEYGAEFRRDVEGFLDAETIAAVTVTGRRELPPLSKTQYVAFTDPSGGSRDSFTLAVGHLEQNGVAVLDAIRETRPPFSPDQVVEQYARLLKDYGLREVYGDRYAGEWPRERFGAHGINYVPAEKTKSDIYREILAPINSGRVALLDHKGLRAQLEGLERKVSRGGRDSIDHPPGGRDDVANAVAGCLVLALERTAFKVPIVGHAGPTNDSRDAVILSDESFERHDHGADPWWWSLRR